MTKKAIKFLTSKETCYAEVAYYIEEVIDYIEEVVYHIEKVAYYHEENYDIYTDCYKKLWQQ